MILTEASVSEIKKRMDRYPQRKSAILPALTVAYWQVGHLSPEIYQEVSRVIKIPATEIAAVASFYTMFPKEPVGKFFIQVCHNISCALLGAEGLIEYLESKLNIKKGETTADGLFTLISVECLGGCTAAPMMMINDKYYEDLTREKVDQILEDLKNQA